MAPLPLALLGGPLALVALSVIFIVVALAVRRLRAFFTLLATVGFGHGAVHAADGQELFVTHCAPCHGTDGKARTPAGKKLGAKDLSESKFADADIEKQILTGTKDQKGNERMPSFKAKLAPDEVAALVAFVKTFRH